MVDDEEYEKLLSSKKSDDGVKDEPTAPVSTPEIESNAGGKKNEDDEGTDNQSGETERLVGSGLKLVYSNSCVTIFVHSWGNIYYKTKQR